MTIKVNIRIMNGAGDKVKGSIRGELPNKLESESKGSIKVIGTKQWDTNAGWTGFNWIYEIKIKVNVEKIKK